MKKYIIIFIVIIIAVTVTAVIFLKHGVSKNSNIKKGDEMTTIVPDYKNSRFKEIYLAGGCFWGVQAFFDRIMGIEYTNVGYANGKTVETDYYSLKKTGHAETVYVVYDANSIQLSEIIEYFYKIIDPTSLNRQGNDQGTQYRTGIYYTDEKDRQVIENITEAEQQKYDKKIVTEIEPLKNYIPAENYHQNYLDNNPGGYCHIDLSNIPREKPVIYTSDYPMPSEDDLKSKLTELQFQVTRQNATEPPFSNKYWNNKEAGLYIDIITGEPLFLSSNKFDSGTGWPSFTRPIQWDVITYKTDKSMGMERIEVRGRSSNSHLGHLFNDGPPAEGGLRFCINSASLDFIRVNELEKRGYKKFEVLFK